MPSSLLPPSRSIWWRPACRLWVLDPDQGLRRLPPPDHTISGRCWSPNRRVPARSSDDFDDAHHALVFVVDCMTMVDKSTDDCWIGERNDDLEHARPLVRCRRYRKSVAQTIIAPINTAYLRHQEGCLVNVEAVILLIGVDHRPLFRIAELDGLVSASLVDNAAVNHE